jgi:hypothetical protein
MVFGVLIVILLSDGPVRGAIPASWGCGPRGAHLAATFPPASAWYADEAAIAVSFSTASR